MNTKEQKLAAFGRLLDIMDDLRAKCPWDMKQTMESLRHLTIEEVYELGDAILEKDVNEIKKELGDILLHIVFYAKIGSESSDFDIADVLNSICDKLIHRHPHIYADVKVENAEEVSRNWEKLKLAEGKSSVLEGVPNSLPALVKAMRIQDKASSAGFDWDNKDQVWEKVQEELAEFKHELREGNTSNKEQEFGDLLFALVNYARFENINPEEVLERTNKKFISRFKFIEQSSAKEGKSMSTMSLAEMDVYWNEAKKLGL